MQTSSRRDFLRASLSAAVAVGGVNNSHPPALRAADAAPDPVQGEFGQHRIFYDNFASHLLNAYNPNVFYPDLPGRWSDADWFAQIDMLADFGFNIFQYWLEPALFCRDGLESAAGREFARQMNALCAHAHGRGVKVHGICCLATVGKDWTTLCPNQADSWAELRRLWDAWSKRLPEQDIFGIFPGDPGACSLGGCTALTYLDRSLEIAQLVRGNCPRATIELNTWGPPFFGWGIIEGPPDWKGEFIAAFQGSAWKFDQARADGAMAHLVRRLPEFPPGTLVSLNMGFDPDGTPGGERDARRWAREVAKTNPVLSWDFSLTEGENAILPHGRWNRLFARRREEQAVGAYSGGIAMTVTPLLNQLSSYAAAQSFLRPTADPQQVAGDFLTKLYGPQGRKLVPYVALFEIVPDWGNHVRVLLDRDQYHARMKELVVLLGDLRSTLDENAVLHPRPADWHAELSFFAELFRDLSGPAPDFDALSRRYWQRVYAIYDRLPRHVDNRPQGATANLINTFRIDGWRGRPDEKHADSWVLG